MSLPHRAMSALMVAMNCSGVEPTGIEPSTVSRF
jgi:hypothetical protein